MGGKRDLLRQVEYCGGGLWKGFKGCPLLENGKSEKERNYKVTRCGIRRELEKRGGGERGEYTGSL